MKCLSTNRWKYGDGSCRSGVSLLRTSGSLLTTRVSHNMKKSRYQLNMRKKKNAYLPFKHDRQPVQTDKKRLKLACWLSNSSYRPSNPPCKGLMQSRHDRLQNNYFLPNPPTFQPDPNYTASASLSPPYSYFRTYLMLNKIRVKSTPTKINFETGSWLQK
jgi:hypothetical protein